jgi:nucleolar protein 14
LNLVLLKLLPINNYPNELKGKVQDLEEFITETNANSPKEYLKCLIKKPTVNKMLEPKVETKSKYDVRHHNSVISEKKLNAIKYKKEYKSAIKEIRQDNSFLARVQLKEQLTKDAKRSRKVKEIMSGLSMQEGEYQKAKRQKN